MREKLFSVAFMFGLMLVFASLVSAVKLATDERIRLNERVKLQRIILKVLEIPVGPRQTDRDVMDLFNKRIRKLEVAGRFVYVGYDSEGKRVIGYALPVGGAGFWGPIYGMAGIDAKGERLLGIDFYRHAETPGLGARMTEDWFRRQFAGLSLLPAGEGGRIFSLKPAGTGRLPGELDAITGATGTSRGIESFLNRELKRFRLEIWDALRRKAAGDAPTS